MRPLISSDRPWFEAIGLSIGFRREILDVVVDKKSRHMMLTKSDPGFRITEP